jgi:hypothetical protein
VIKVKVEYRLSEKARAEGIKQGQELSSDQTLVFQPSDLSEKARELWVQLFGSATYITLCLPNIEGGYVWSDGSASEQPPQVRFSGDRYESDKILTVNDLEAVLTEIIAKKAKLEAEISERTAKWQKARAAYTAHLLERKAKEEAEKKAKAEAEQAKAQRMANLPWVKQLTQKLAVESEAEAEIKRFCQKFALQPEDIKTDSISDKPYVRITATVPITVSGMERELKITNKIFSDVGQDPYSEYLPAEFSDLCHAIAEALAEILNGKVTTIYNYDRGEAYLNVVTGSDTIEVASCDLERSDC